MAMARFDSGPLWLAAVVGLGAGAGSTYVALRPRIVEPTQRVAELEQALAEIRAERDQLVGELQAREQELARALGERDRLASSEAALAARISALERERDTLRAELERQGRQAQADLETLRKSLDACQQELARLRGMPPPAVPPPAPAQPVLAPGTVLVRVEARPWESREGTFRVDAPVRVQLGYRLSFQLIGGCTEARHVVFLWRRGVTSPLFSDSAGVERQARCIGGRTTSFKSGASPAMVLQPDAYRLAITAVGAGAPPSAEPSWAEVRVV